MRFAIALILIVVALTGCHQPVGATRPCYSVGDTLGWVTITTPDTTIRVPLLSKLDFCTDTFNVSEGG